MGSPAMTELVRSIWLFMTHRTGSNYVSSILYQNKLGVPKEYFNHHFTNPLWKANQIQRRNAVLRLISDNSLDGIFAVKLPFHHFLAMINFLNLDPLEVSSNMPHFGRTDFLWIRRRDKFIQAVSYWKAQLTGRWILRDGDDHEDNCVKYDYDGINKCYEQICREEFLWTELFSRAGIKVQELVYEDFVHDSRVLEQVILDLKRCERSVVNSISLVSDHKKVGNLENELLRERFVSDCFRRNA